MEDGVLCRAKLTKRFFMGLPDSTYISSNAADETGCPVFAEPIEPLEGRANQWKRIVAAKANGRLCNVFKDKASYVRWHDRVGNAPGSEWSVS